MTHHYPDLGSASDWLKRSSCVFQPIRSTTKIWVVTRHQYGISALVTQTSFREGISGDLTRRPLFSQAIKLCHFSGKVKIHVKSAETLFARFGIHGLKLFRIVVMMDDICSLDYRVAYRFLLCVLKHEKYQPKT